MDWQRIILNVIGWGLTGFVGGYVTGGWEGGLLAAAGMIGANVHGLSQPQPKG